MLMKRTGWLAACGCLAALGWVTAAHADVTVDFESYTPGALIGQDGWFEVTGGSYTATIVAGGPGSSTQCLELGSGTDSATFRLHRTVADQKPVDGVVIFTYDIRFVDFPSGHGDLRPRLIKDDGAWFHGIAPGHGGNGESGPGSLEFAMYCSSTPDGASPAFVQKYDRFPQGGPDLNTTDGLWHTLKYAAYFGTQMGAAHGNLLYIEVDGVRTYTFNHFMESVADVLDILQIRGTGNATSPYTIQLDNFSATVSGAVNPLDLPTAAGVDKLSEPCGAASLDATGSQSNPAGNGVAMYAWVDFTGGTPARVKVAPTITTTTDLVPCSATSNLNVVVADAVTGYQSVSAPVAITVGGYNYGVSPLDFSAITALPVGVDAYHYYRNSMATDGTYLYHMNNENGALYRTLGSCGATWEQMPSAPSGQSSDSGALAYAPGLGASGSLVTFRGGVVTVYDIATNGWSQYANQLFGSTGYVVAGNSMFGNGHAQDVNQGGPLHRIDLTDLNAPYCTRSSLRRTFAPFLTSPNFWWFSRVVQMAYQPLDGMIYGIKNDWDVGTPTTVGERLYRFDPADFAPPYENTFFGPNFDDWTRNNGLLGEDLGRLPYDAGYGAAVVAVPAGWKGFIGNDGGVFVIFGRPGGNQEGFGTPNNKYGVYDVETGQWYLGDLPDFSSSGTAAVFFDGNVYIKQGCSDSSNPDGSPTPTVWVSLPQSTPPSVDAGTDQTLAGTCGEYTSVNLTGSSPDTITTWEWSEGATLLSTQQNPTIDFKLGQHEVTLTVTDDNCSSASDTVIVNITGGNPLPVVEALDNQINFNMFGDPNFDAIENRNPTQIVGISFGFEDGEGFTHADLLGGGFWYDPTIDLVDACYGTPLDLSQEGLLIRYEARFNQEFNASPYADAPIGVIFIDANGLRGAIGFEDGSINWPYGPIEPVSNRWPVWKQCEAPIIISNPDPTWTDAGFDVTRVVALQFFGTDWDGTALDYIEIKNLVIGQFGACCDNGDNCSVTTEMECTGAGGTFLGNGTLCGTLLYNYSNATIDAALEDISATGSGGPNTDDGGQTNVPLGFSFEFFGESHTTVNISANGFITFSSDPNGWGVNQPIPTAPVPNDFIAPAWYDWNVQQQGAIYFQTLGTAPNRRFIVMWDDVAFYDNQGNESNTFEVILHETSNEIEFRYGPMEPRTGFPDGNYGVTPTIGIEGPDGMHGIGVSASVIGAGGSTVTQAFALDSITDTNPCLSGLLGDMNCDSMVNGDDAQGMVLGLVDPAGYASQYPGCNILNGDFTSNGMLEFDDIAGFVAALLQ